MSIRNHETAIAQNENLHHELDMYKSVMVPLERKPRTNITRITRPPLVNLNHQSFGECRNFSSAGNAVLEKGQAFAQLLDTIPGDMTLEELT